MLSKKIFAIILITTVFGYFILPEVVVKEKRKEAVEYIAKEMDYPPSICNFLVNTKVGRKLSYIVLKSEVKKEIKSWKKDIKKAIK